MVIPNSKRRNTSFAQSEAFILERKEKRPHERYTAHAKELTRLLERDENGMVSLIHELRE